MAIAHEDYHQHSAYVIEPPTFTVFPSRARRTGPAGAWATGSIKEIDRALLPETAGVVLVCLRLASHVLSGRIDQSPTVALAVNGEGIRAAV